MPTSRVQSTPFQLSLGAWIIMSASLQNIIWIWIISCVRYCKLLFPKYESVRSTGCPLHPLANCFALSECWKDNGHQKPIKFTLKKSFLNHLIKNMQCSFQKTCIVLWHRNSGGLLGHGIVHIDGWQVNLKHNKCKRREESAKNACKSMVFLKWFRYAEWNFMEFQKKNTSYRNFLFWNQAILKQKKSCTSKAKATAAPLHWGKALDTDTTLHRLSWWTET